MGQKQSSEKKVSFVPSGGSGIIKISDDVVDRLRNEITEKNRPKDIKSKNVYETSIRDQKEQFSENSFNRYNDSSPDFSESSQKFTENSLSKQHPTHIIHYVEKPSLSALKVKSDKENEIHQIENYWQKRLLNLKEHELHYNEIKMNSFKSAFSDIEDIFFNFSKKASCLESRNNLLKCYNGSSVNSLLCENQANFFSVCCESLRFVRN